MADKIIVPVDLDTLVALKKFEQDALKSGAVAGENASKGFGKKFNDTSESFFGNFRSRLLALGAAFSAVSIFKKSIQAASEQEVATKRLNSALALSGKFTDQVGKDFANLANEIQRTTKFTDDAVTNAASTIQILSNLPVSQLKQATIATTDLAAALRIDLDSASRLVAKAANGSADALSKYGIKIDESIPKSERFAEVLRIIETRFGGLAKQDLNTFTGQLTATSNAFGDILEELGFFITESPAVIQFLSEIRVAFNGVAKLLADARQTFNLGVVLAAFAAIGSAFVSLVISPIESGIFGISALFQANGQKLQKFALDTIQLLVKVAGALNSLGIGGGGIGTQGQAIIDQFNANIDQVQQKIAQSDEQLNSTPFADGLKSKIDSLGEKFLELGDKVKMGTDKVNNSLDKTKGNVIDFRQVAIANISGGTQGFVKALQSGENAFDAFGSMILDVMGNVAIFIGETLIAAGIGIDALKASLAGFGGGAAIAAGIALVALGAILKGLAGGKATAGTGAAGASSPSTSTATQDVTPELEREKPQSLVNVNVNGSIFDSRDTARRLADLINSGFDQEGLRVRSN
jgi:hypothetical protein